MGAGALSLFGTLQKEPLKLNAVKGTSLIVDLDIHGCFLYVCLLATVSLMLILDALDNLKGRFVWSLVMLDYIMVHIAQGTHAIALC